MIRLEVDLDEQAALHLRFALDRHLTYCSRYAYSVPDEIQKLAGAATAAARGETTKHDERRDAQHHETDEQHRLFYSQRAFARLVGRSERTVQRWVADGRVDATLAGIPRAELDRLSKRRTRR